MLVLVAAAARFSAPSILIIVGHLPMKIKVPGLLQIFFEIVAVYPVMEYKDQKKDYLTYQYP